MIMYAYGAKFNCLKVLIFFGGFSTNCHISKLPYLEAEITSELLNNKTNTDNMLLSCITILTIGLLQW